MNKNSNNSNAPQALGYALAALATLIWSGNFVVARGVVDSFPPVALALFRWTAAVVVILPIAAPGLWKDRGLIRENILYFSVVGFLGVTLFNTIVYISGHTTDTVNLSLIASSSPIFLIILSRIFLGEPITLNRVIGVFIAISGVVILVTGGKVTVITGLSFNRGDIYMVFAALVFGVYSVLVRKRPQELSHLTFLAAVFLGGFLLLVPWAMWEWADYGTPHVNSGMIWIFLYLGIGNSILCFLFWNNALEIIGPARTGLIYYTLPIFSGVEAYLILGEGIGPADIVGGGLIISGIVIGTLPRGALSGLRYLQHWKRSQNL